MEKHIPQSLERAKGFSVLTVIYHLLSEWMQTELFELLVLLSSSLMSEKGFIWFFPNNQYFGVPRRFAVSLKLRLHKYEPAALSFSRVILQPHSAAASGAREHFWHVVIPPDTVGKLIFHRSQKGNDKETNQFFVLVYWNNCLIFQLWLSAATKKVYSICHKTLFTKLLSL